MGLSVLMTASISFLLHTVVEKESCMMDFMPEHLYSVEFNNM